MDVLTIRNGWTCLRFMRLTLLMSKVRLNSQIRKQNLVRKTQLENGVEVNCDLIRVSCVLLILLSTVFRQVTGVFLLRQIRSRRCFYVFTIVTCLFYLFTVTDLREICFIQTDPPLLFLSRSFLIHFRDLPYSFPGNTNTQPRLRIISYRISLRLVVIQLVVSHMTSEFVDERGDFLIRERHLLSTNLMTLSDNRRGGDER